VEVALGGLDAAADAGECVGVVYEDLAHGGDFAEEGLVDAFALRFVAFGLDAGHAAHGPEVLHKHFDQGGFGGSGGLVLLEVIGGELFESGGVFAHDDLGLGVDAVLEGVEADGGFALGGAGAGGLLRVGAVGGDLAFGGHNFFASRVAVERGFTG
jgi:hypothetical protein